jgi:hypothetical protein
MGNIAQMGGDPMDGATSVICSVATGIIGVAQEELELWESGQMRSWGGSGSSTLVSNPANVGAGSPDKYTILSPAKETGRFGWQREQWCSDFVAWVVLQAGHTLPTNATAGASTWSKVDGQPAGKGKTRRWHPVGDGYQPQPGDIIYHTYGHVSIYLSDGDPSKGIIAQHIGGNQTGRNDSDWQLSTSEVTQVGNYSVGGYATIE